MSRVVRFLRTAYFGVRAPVERRVPFWPEERIRWLQEWRLRAIVRHAYATVPFYREAMDGLGLRPQDIRTADDLARLPLIDGERVRAEPQAFLSCRYAAGGTRELYSTGTAAHGRRLVPWDERALVRGLVYGERDRAVLYRMLGKKTRLCRLSLLPPESTTRAVTDFHASSVWIPSRAVRTHFVSPELSYEEIAARMNDVRPDVVFSYGSFAEHFARYILDRSLPLRPPRVWVYGADALSENGRTLLEQGLGCLVHSTYQAVEAGRIGFLCEEHRGFHLNIDLCSVRIADAQGRTVDPGVSGDVVISNLSNRATVLLNYRLGDRATAASSPCPCGRTLPRLERLEGRLSDVLRLSSGREILDNVLLHACKEELRQALQFQIVEEAPGRFRWLVVPGAEADRPRLERGLREKARRVLDPGDLLQIQFVDRLPVGRSSKLSRVVRERPAERRDAP